MSRTLRRRKPKREQARHSRAVVERCVAGARAGMSTERIAGMVGLPPALVNAILDEVARHVIENAEPEAGADG